MKSRIYLILIIIPITLFCCSDEDRIFNAYKNDKELSEGDAVPFILEQNDPNPFNPSTVIAFRVATTLKLNLTVYTEDWMRVETLFNETVTVTEQPVTYRITFEKQDIPSGEYYYTLKGGDYIQVRKMKVTK